MVHGELSRDVAPARMTGVVPSFLQPLDKPVPMIATADIGRVAAELFQECWSGRRVIELEGPHRVTPNEIAAAFSKILGRHIRMEAVPRERWEALFTSQGMRTRCRVFRCSMASTRAGLNSKAVWPPRSREKSSWRRL